MFTNTLPGFSATYHRRRLRARRERSRPVPFSPSWMTAGREPEDASPASSNGVTWMQPNRVVARFRAQVSADARAEILAELGARVADRLAGGDLMLEIEGAVGQVEAARRLTESGLVAFCRPMNLIAVAYAPEPLGVPPATLPTLRRGARTKQRRPSHTRSPALGGRVAVATSSPGALPMPG